MTKKIKLSLVFTLLLSVMVCLFGGLMVQSAAANNEYESFVMQNGATIKISEETAIRFTTEISKTDYQAVQTKYGEDAKIEIITVFTRTDYLNDNAIADEDFTIDTLEQKGVFFKNIKFSLANGRLLDSGEKYISNACIYDIDAANIAEEFSARSFLSVNDSVVASTVYSEENNAMSVYEVAKEFAGVMEEDWQNDVLADLCADYEIKIAATDYNEEISITVKNGESLSDYYAQIEEQLTVENFAYFAGLDGADMNAPIESGATYTPSYRAVVMEDNGEGYTVKGINMLDTDTTVIEIPATFNGKPVTEVGGGAFWTNTGAGGHNTTNYQAVTKIVLPESVTLIRTRAFSHLANLETIIMPGVTELSPNNSWLAFYDCSSLKTIVVGESLSVLQGVDITDHRVFFSDAICVGVDVYYSTPNSWWSIHEASYSNRMLSGNEYYYSETDCLNTWKYDANGNVVKSSVTSHGAYVDGNCSVCGRIQTTGVRYALNEDGESYKVSSYSGTDKEIYVAAEYNGKPVTVYAAWNRDLSVEKVVMPESITLMTGAFFECRSLKVVIMPGVVAWEGSNKFHNDVALEYVVVNVNAKIIDRVFHFDKTNDLAEHVGSTVLCVDGASSSGLSFSGDYNLLSGKKLYYNEKDCIDTWKYTDSTKTDIIISDATEHSYEDGLCENCGIAQTAGLTYTLNADEQSYSVTGYTGTATEVYVAGTYLGKPVTAVGGSAFWTYGYPNTGKTNNGNITKVVLPKSITTIGGSCFRNQYYLETVIMPGVTRIDVSVHNMQFHNCVSLKTVVVGESLEITKNNTSGDGANRVFAYDASALLSGMTTVETSLYISSEKGTATYFTGSGWTYFNGMLSANRTYNYDEDGCGGTWTYDENGNIKLNQHSCEDGLCVKCGALQTAGLIYELNEDGLSYKVTGYKGSDTEIYVAKEYEGKPVTAMGDNAFWRYGNTNFTNYDVTKVVLPESVTFLGSRCFSQMYKLKTVIAPGVTKIDTSVVSMQFFNSFKLETVVFGDSIEISGGARCFAYDDNDTAYRNPEFNPEWQEGDRITVSIYLTSADGSASFENAESNGYYNIMLSKDRVFHYSEDEKAGCWHYDENGMPVLW